MAENKYGKYILRNVVVHPVPKTRSHTPSVSSREELWPGLTGQNCNFGVNSITEPYLLPDPPHKHDFDEYLFFIGGNPLNMEEFDAEIDVALGEEWEVNTITTTSVIYIPKGMQHCPINVKRVGKPFLFGHIMLSSKYSNDSKAGELFTHDEKKTKPKAEKGQ
jgi:hypothetical protein